MALSARRSGTMSFNALKQRIEIKSIIFLEGNNINNIIFLMVAYILFHEFEIKLKYRRFR